MEEKKNRERDGKVQRFLSPISLLNTLYNIKSKVKDIFYFGRNYPNVPPVLPTIHTSPTTFQFVQFSPSFLKFSLPINPYYNSTFTLIGFCEINRTNLHKISINTQIHLIYFYYHLYFKFRNHIRLHKHKGLTILPP